MARTNSSDVLDIVTTSLGAGSVDAHINVANRLVTNWLGSTDLTDETLREIERQVAAHLVSLQDPRNVEEGADGVRVKRERPTLGEGLAGTPYGQTAISLDTTGTLAQLTDASQQTAFVYRAGGA